MEAVDGGIGQLQEAVATLLAEDPSGWDAGPALERARLILALQQQLEVPALRAIADVDAREAFVHAECGSTRDWLRTQVAGDGGRLGRAQRWARRAAVVESVADGRVGAAGADAVCAAVAKIEQLSQPPLGRTTEAPLVGADQVIGVLRDAIPGMLSLWIGQGLDPAERTDEHWSRRERLAQVLTECADDELAAPADRLEPALVLLAEALAPSNLAAALGAVVDALQPLQCDAEADQLREKVFVRLTKRPDGPGWDLAGLLDDVTGAQLDAALRARRRQAAALAAEHAQQAAEAAALEQALDQLVDDDGEVDAVAGDADADPEASGEAGELAVDRFGQAGPGLPPLPLSSGGRPRFGGAGRPVEGEPQRSGAQSLADALALLLTDLDHLPADLVASGTPRPAHLTITASQSAFEGEPGAAPASLATTTRPIRLAPEVARGLACGGILAMVGLDRHQDVVHDSGEHRHATRRQRRAMQARWGSACAVNGCTQVGVIPHHVLWFSKGGRTVLDNLVPVCLHHHHDLHEGHRTLRLRDGRLINPDGWVLQQRSAA